MVQALALPPGEKAFQEVQWHTPGCSCYWVPRGSQSDQWPATLEELACQNRHIPELGGQKRCQKRVPLKGPRRPQYNH